MRYALRAAMLLLFACFSLSQAKAELPYNQFMDVCVGECSKSADKDYCTSYCQCTVDGLKATGDDAAQTAAMTNAQSMHNITMTCAGKHSIDVFVKSCKSRCTAATCPVCDCVLGEVKALGSDQKIGEFFANVGRGDPAAKAQMTTMQSKCAK
jgi:hypothetical protein